VIDERLAELKSKEAQFKRSLDFGTGGAGGTSTPAAEQKKPSPEREQNAEEILIEAERQIHRVKIGDTVRVRYLTDDKRLAQFTISRDRSDPMNGIIHYKKPIAEALLGAEEGDEIEILVASYLPPAILEKIINRLHWFSPMMSLCARTFPDPRSRRQPRSLALTLNAFGRRRGR
jgi:hypothetical protein